MKQPVKTLKQINNWKGDNATKCPVKEEINSLIMRGPLWQLFNKSR